ncbi:MAG: hypothetical protein ACTIL2_04230 [Corynebacterium sp.]|uniref:hypothetical protein n=1 Tax=Corynebacterium sp. TaxID=1720 RepID=UPI003F97CE71
MLALSLLLALLGFIALLVALYVGSTLWAWICICIAVVGVVTFVVDLVIQRRR